MLHILNILELILGIIGNSFEGVGELMVSLLAWVGDGS